MEQAIWTNQKGEKILVNIVGKSSIRASYVMIQKSTATSAIHGCFSVSPEKLVML